MYINLSDLKKNGGNLLDAVAEAIRQETRGKNLAWTGSESDETEPAIWLLRDGNGIDVRYAVWCWSYGMEQLFPDFYGSNEKESGPGYVLRVNMGIRDLGDDPEREYLYRAAEEVLGVGGCGAVDWDALAEEVQQRIEQREQELISAEEREISEEMCVEIFRQRLDNALPEGWGSFEEWATGQN